MEWLVSPQQTATPPPVAITGAAAAAPNDFEGLQVGCYRGDGGAASSVAVIAAPLAAAAALAVWKLESEGEKCQRL